MSLGSQSTNVQAMSGLTGLAHEIFSQGVKWHVLANSPTAQLFKRANKNEDYKVQGEALVGAAQLSYANGAMATGGKLPDHQFRDAVQWQVTPTRRYRRIAQDNFVVARASGEGAFQDLGSMIFDQLWDSWGRMEIRHAIGDSRGYVALCSSRTNATVVVLKDGYGHTGTDPLLHVEPGSILGWLDASNSYALKWSAAVSSVAYSTGTVTFSSDIDDGATTIAANDPIVFTTTVYDPSGSQPDYYESEYNNAPHGVGGILDPDANNTTTFDISESTHPRWKPLREASSSFDQYEVAEHWRHLRSHSTSPVTAQTHVAVTQGGVVAELARSLDSYQQQETLGRTFEGGYQAVRISIPGAGPMDLIEDDFFYHDILATLCVEDIYRADLEGEADFYENDGSMWSRLPDEDAQEAYVREYMQTFGDRRNRHGALTDITLANVTSSDFTPVGNL